MFNYSNIDPSECEYIAIGPDSEIPDGKRIFLEIDNISIVVFRVGGKLYAIEDICSHDDGPLGDGDLDRYEIVCPRHGARFDIRTGKATSLPAVEDIKAYPVRVSDAQIELGLPIAK